jgi:hypothetical protein
LLNGWGFDKPHLHNFKPTGKIMTAQSQIDGRIVQAPLSLLAADPDQPRKTFAEDLTPVINFARNPTVIYSKPPRQAKAKK